MKRVRVRIQSPLAYYHAGKYAGYKQALEMLKELPDLYGFDPGETAAGALEGHKVNITTQMQQEFCKLVVAVSVYCGVDKDIDTDSSDNFRIVFAGDDIYAMLAFRERYEMPVLGSLKRPRFPHYED
jgi:hypothetical protein